MSTAQTPMRDPATSEFGRYGDLEWPEARALAEEYADRVRAIIARGDAGSGWQLWVGPGWFPLICELDAALAAINPDYEVLQVKEKLGGLRYYIQTPRDPQMEPLISAAHERSWAICEVCGRGGELRSDHGSLRVTCATHAPKGSHSLTA